MSEHLKLGCVILAAGLSRRAGAVNKLLYPIEGSAMVRRTAQAIVEAGFFAEVVVVLGYQAAEVQAVLEGLPLRFARNDNHEEGMGSSLAVGASSLLDDELQGILVCMGDLPWLVSGEVRKVAEAFEGSGGQRVVVPMHGDVPGHPVAFPRRLFAKLQELRGDAGAKRVIALDGEEPLHVSVGAGCIRDLDQPSD